MKKLIVFVLVAVLFTMPVLAGWEEEVNISSVAYTIGAHTVKPVLDGKLDGPGAYTKIAYRSTEISYAWDDNVPNAEEWAKGLTWELYASYDANNIYVLVAADANHYFNELDDGDGNAWQYSAIQVSIADGADMGTDRLEYGIWRKSNDGGQGGVVWAQHPAAKAEFTPTAGTNYSVGLEGGKLYYETVIPVNTFLNYDTVGEGDVIGLNIVIAQADAENVGHIHTQYSSGCTGDPGKDADRFANITLGVPITVAAEVAVSEGIKLQGELIGSEMGWGENANAGRAAAFDGDPATYFDPTTPSDPADYCGISVSEPYTLTEIRIHPRDGQLGRFNGAAIYGFNGGEFDPFGTSTLIWESDMPADEFVWQIITKDNFLVKDQKFTHYAYFNGIDHGDVGEIELYGIPESGLPTENVDETASGGGEENVHVESPAPAPAPEVVAPPAPDTGDNGLAMFVIMIIISTGLIVSQKRIRAK